MLTELEWSSFMYYMMKFSVMSTSHSELSTPYPENDCRLPFIHPPPTHLFIHRGDIDWLTYPGPNAWHMTNPKNICELKSLLPWLSGMPRSRLALEPLSRQVLGVFSDQLAATGCHSLDISGDSPNQKSRELNLEVVQARVNECELGFYHFQTMGPETSSLYTASVSSTCTAGIIPVLPL
jgi:hypothetical protein